jgi:hypothetical protein
MPNRRPVSTKTERASDDNERASEETERASEETEQTGGESEQASDGQRSRLTAAQAGRYGLEQIAELTGKETEGVTGVEPADDGGWRVTVEVVEDRRIPSSSDILSSYRTELGPDGELLSYRRIRRYARGRGDDGVS